MGDHLKPRHRDPATEDFEPLSFLRAQNPVYASAVQELKRGRKEGHWIWFIFPQLQGLGTSIYSDIYSLRSAGDAKQFLQNETLRNRLEECVQAAMHGYLMSGNALFTPHDWEKFHACMTLFNNVAPESVYRTAIKQLFDGRYHALTIALLRPPSIFARAKSLFTGLMSR